MLLDNYQGKLIISQPRCRSEVFSQGVVLVAKHNNNGAWGILLNKQLPHPECSLSEIIEHVGMDNPHYVDSPVFLGGPVERGRISVVHSSDWHGPSTQDIAPDLCVTTDISVLSAITMQDGPARFRVFAGLSVWSSGQLDGEMRGEEPWTTAHKWLSIDADTDIVFDFESDDQWHQALALAVNREVKEWF